MSELFVGLAIGLAVAVLLYVACRAKVPAPLLILLAIAPIAFVYLANPPARVYSNHGFMHASIVYQIMHGDFPPLNPLLHGEPLAYPWLYHLLAAGLSVALKLSPFNAFAAINVFCLVVAAITVFKLAKMVFDDRPTAIMAVAMSLFGMTAFGQGPLAHLVRSVARPASSVVRGVPLLAKFVNINPNPLGIMFFAILLYGVVGVFGRRERALHHWAAIGGAVVGTGLFYPFLLPAIWACCAATVVVTVLRERRKALPQAAALVLCTAVGTLVALPYVLGIGSARAESSQLQLVFRFGRVLSHGGTLLLTMGVLIALMALKRRTLWGASRVRRSAVLLLISASATTGLLYIFCSAPLATEYKYLLLSFMSLGIVAAPCLWDEYRRRPVAAVALHACLLMPLGSLLLDAATADWKLTDEYHEVGRNLRHADDAQAALYSWISENTASDAVFVDSQPTIPIFAQRQLYVSVDFRQRGARRGRIWDGWGMSPVQILTESHGYPASKIAKRVRMVAALYDRRAKRVHSRIISELIKTTGQADVYVVARGPSPRELLSEDNRLQEEFRNAAAVVYRVLK